jgi:hypothetical protein
VPVGAWLEREPQAAESGQTVPMPQSWWEAPSVASEGRRRLEPEPEPAELPALLVALRKPLA